MKNEENQDFNLASQLLELGVTLPQNILDKQKVFLRIKVKSKPFHSLEEIMKMGDLQGVSGDWTLNKKNKKILFAPISKYAKSKNLALYYEGNQQQIPKGTDIYRYFYQRGLGPIKQEGANVLVNVMNFLTDDLLTTHGIPIDTHIVLLSDFVLPNKELELSLPCIYRSKQGRILSMMPMNEKFDERFAFIVMDKLV